MKSFRDPFEWGVKITNMKKGSGAKEISGFLNIVKKCACNWFGLESPATCYLCECHKYILYRI